ncbi:MAG: rod shape-determining protein [Nitrospinae bacterium]|nr:rod shape-determining protein [Nitrospinota bacterium]
MNWFQKIVQLFSTDLAMDLGTANTLLYARGEGIVINEPSVVALAKNSGKLLAIGGKAKAMYGKTPEQIDVIRPMKDGVIADFDSTRKMIDYFIKKAQGGRRMGFRPKIIIGVPSGITQVEKRAVMDSATAAGAREVRLIEEPMAAAIGTGMPVGESCGNLIVDIGGGTTEVAIISMYATAYVESIRVAGDEMDEAIVRYLRQKHNLDIGVFEGERVKMTIGSAYPLERQIKMKVYGRDIVTGLPSSITLTNDDARLAIEEPIRAIFDAVRKALENTTPEFAHDISERGIVLAGGGSLIKGLGKALNAELNVPVYRAKDPLLAVARGAGVTLEEWETYKRVCIS